MLNYSLHVLEEEILRSAGFKAANDDRAECLVEAISVYLRASNR